MRLLEISTKIVVYLLWNLSIIPMSFRLTSAWKLRSLMQNKQFGSRLYTVNPSVGPWVSGDVPHSWRITCMTDEVMENLGQRLAPFVGNADVILLKGDLGAGKTTFSRGLIRAKFDDDDMRVTSPSYLLDNTYEYDEDMYIHHMDLYRLPTGCDLSMLGIPDIYTTSLCLIEWPQRMDNKALPAEYLDMNFYINKENESRCITLTPYGERWIQKLALLVADSDEAKAT